MLLQRLGQRSLKWPMFKAMGERGVRDAGSFHPIGKAQRLAQKGDQMIARVIAGLLFRSRPPAIHRFVVAVVVDALYRCIGWAWSHVGKELREAIQPLRADRNPAPAVSLIAVLLQIRAALFHGMPDLVFGRVLAVLRASVNWCAADLVVEAAAAFRRPASQRSGHYPLLISAYAGAKPIHAASATLFGLFGSGQSPKDLTGQVVCYSVPFAHTSIIGGC